MAPARPLGGAPPPKGTCRELPFIPILAANVGFSGPYAAAGRRAGTGSGHDGCPGGRLHPLRHSERLDGAGHPHRFDGMGGRHPGRPAETGRRVRFRRGGTSGGAPGCGGRGRRAPAHQGRRQRRSGCGAGFPRVRAGEGGAAPAAVGAGGYVGPGEARRGGRDSHRNQRRAGSSRSGRGHSSTRERSAQCKSKSSSIAKSSSGIWER